VVTIGERMGNRKRKGLGTAEDGNIHVEKGHRGKRGTFVIGPPGRGGNRVGGGGVAGKKSRGRGSEPLQKCKGAVSGSISKRPNQ